MKPTNLLKLVTIFSFFTAMSANAQFSAEDIERAVLPLPEELRADATVFTYDESGERVVLRAGTNHVECQPKNADGFTRCSPASASQRADFTARMTAQGLSGDELQAAVSDAEIDGLIPSPEFGSLRYRLYEEGDRIQLLWVVTLPNATSEDLGMPTGSQRDSSLAGMGLPWMMREGTPNAHLMIPINATELSNPITH
ncbi:hypothetical protein JYT97_02785 [Haliea sp. AH-315-K21]|uniref:Uncharacterized protein n=1 Tax=SAR86 cluster bacterium TaxID=2030880 RepID=A0A2A5C7F2_9GAMM|nr:hypothetical protein [Haliea sp. AH-315-K21]PCJ39400.1 MAG: hypothetical protein COA71_14130 [SAR86 cluster bacterium]